MLKLYSTFLRVKPCDVELVTNGNGVTVAPEAPKLSYAEQLRARACELRERCGDYTPAAGDVCEVFDLEGGCETLAILSPDVALVIGEDGLRVTFPALLKYAVKVGEFSLTAYGYRMVTAMECSEARDSGDPAETRLIEVYNPEKRGSEWVEVKR